MKRYLVLALFVLSAQIAFSQISSYDGGMAAYRKIEKDVFGTASMLAYYKVLFRKDSTKTDHYSEAQCVLQISDAFTCFADYYQLKADSLEGVLVHKGKGAGKACASQWGNAAERINFRSKVLTDLAAQTIRVQLFTGLRDYEYTSPQPQLNWRLLSGDSIVNGVSCNKATCHYAGRAYIAWYTEEIACPYGPYIFGGLPGLIMEIHDTNRNWIFTNNGVTQGSASDDLYLYKKGFISGSVKVTTREKALDALRNETENMSNLVVETAGMQVLKQGKWVTPEQNKPRVPSNLIEQQW